MAENSKYNQIVKEKVGSFYDLFIPYTPVEFEHEYTKKILQLFASHTLEALTCMAADHECLDSEHIKDWESIKQEIQKL